MDNMVKFADSIFNSLPIDDVIKMAAYKEYMEITKKSLKNECKKAIMALCVHNAVVREGNYISMNNICNMLKVKPEAMKNARKYFRDNKIIIERESVKDIATSYLKEININHKTAAKITEIIEQMASMQCLMRFTINTIILAIIFLISEVDSDIYCDTMAINKMTLNNALKEIKNIEFLKIERL